MWQILGKASPWALLSWVDWEIQNANLNFYCISSSLLFIYLFVCICILLFSKWGKKKKTTKEKAKVDTDIFERWLLSILHLVFFPSLTPGRKQSKTSCLIYRQVSNFFAVVLLQRRWCVCGILYPTLPVSRKMMKGQTLSVLSHFSALPDHMLAFVRLAYKISCCLCSQ